MAIKITDKFSLEITKLNSGKYVARPANQLGTAGSSPFLWLAVCAPTRKGAKLAFINAHQEDIANL